MKLIITSPSQVSPTQQKQIKRLQQICFGHVPEKEIKEHFFPKNFAWVFAVEDKKIVGIVGLYKRQREFDGVKFLLGGAAGVCVDPEFRKKGVGSALIKKALEVLGNKGSDVACMSVDLENPMYSFYEKLGFKMMEREFSFDDIHGKRIYDQGAMFIPLNSQSVYNHIINSDKTFHYGRGYW